MSYRKKHIKNKIHKIRLKKSIFKMPVFWISIAVVILVLAVLYFLLFFYGFQIKSVTISGNEKVQAKDIEEFVDTNINRKIINVGNWNLMSRSIFFADSKKLQQEILNKFPAIKTATVERELPQSVNIKIEEKKPVAIFCSPTSSEQSGEKCFYIDKNGIIFEELNGFTPDMPVIRRDRSNETVFAGESVVDENIISAIAKIGKDLKDNFQIDIKEALISSPLRLDIKTNENWQIFFDLNAGADLPIIKLNSLLKNEITQTSREKLQYIDLRFKDRAYYK